MYVTWNTSKTRHNETQINLNLHLFWRNELSSRSQLSVDGCYGKVAERHDLKVLFHEKPLKVNGSGKHNNWSLATDTGVNLLSPSKTPMSNLQF
jgi:glutamine synthetase